MVWLAETLLLVCFLVWLNIQGIRESSMFNEIVGIAGIATEVGIVVLGFVLAWSPELLLRQWTMEMPTLDRFMYGSSLAIISFVGLESISRLPRRRGRPATIVPRTSISLVFTVFIFAVAFSTLSMGIVPWQDFVGGRTMPWRCCRRIPYLGLMLVPSRYSGAIILAISANSGVMSASRLTYCMSRYQLLSTWFDKVHPSSARPRGPSSSSR